MEPPPAQRRRLEPLPVSATLGREPKHTRECGFCPKKGNWHTSGARAVTWTLCQRLRFRMRSGGPEQVMEPPASRFPLLPGEDRPQLSPELTPRGDSLTPHWACGDCCTKQRRWLVADHRAPAARAPAATRIAAGAAPTGLPREAVHQARGLAEAVGMRRVAEAGDGPLDVPAISGVLNHLVRQGEPQQEEGAGETSRVGRIGPQKTVALAVAQRQHIAQPHRRDGATWEFENTGAQPVARAWSLPEGQVKRIAGFSMFGTRALWEQECSSPCQGNPAGGAPLLTIGARIVFWLEHSRSEVLVGDGADGVERRSRVVRTRASSAEAQKDIVSLAYCNVALWKGNRVAVLARGTIFRDSFLVLKTELARVKRNHRQNLDNRQAGYAGARANAAERRIERMQEQLDRHQQRAEAAELRADRERRTRRRVERRHGELGSDDEAEDDEEPSWAEIAIREAKNGAFKPEIRDALVKGVIQRSTKYCHAVPALVDNLATRFPEQMAAEQEAANASGNKHHSVSKCINEVDMMVFLELCFQLAARKGFDESMIPEGPMEPDAMNWHHRFSDFSGKGCVEEPENASDDERRRAAEYDEAVRKPEFTDPLPESEVQTKISELMHEKRNRKPDAVLVGDSREHWSPSNDDTDVGALLAYPDEADGGSKSWYVHQIVSVETLPDPDGSNAAPSFRHTMRSVDPEDASDYAGEEWTEAELEGADCVYLGTAKTAAQEAEAAFAIPADHPLAPPSLPTPSYDAPAIGCDETSFWDHKGFMLIFMYLDGEANVERRKRLSWLFRVVGAHNPGVDTKMLAENFEIIRAVQHMIGVPIHMQAWDWELKHLIVDNEPSNMGDKTGLIKRWNRRCRRAQRWGKRWRLVAPDAEYEEIEGVGCHYHLLNIADRRASKAMRKYEEEELGFDMGERGKDKDESYSYWAARFLSRALRNNADWTSYLETKYEDTANWTKCVRSRFFSRLGSAEFFHDRFDWVFEWYGTVKEKELRKQTAVSRLMTDLLEHRSHLEQCVKAMRVSQEWITRPLAHTAEDDLDGGMKRHLQSLRKRLGEAEELQTCDLEAAKLWSREMKAVELQKADLIRECAARVRDRGERSGEGAIEISGRRVGLGGDLGYNRAGRLQRKRVANDTFEQRKREVIPAPPTELQLLMLRNAAKAFVGTFQQYASNVLEDDADPTVVTTWDIERANADCRRIHDTMTNAKEATFRSHVRLRQTCGDCVDKPSGCMFGWTHPPAAMEASGGWLLTGWRAYVRNVVAGAKTQRDYREETRREEDRLQEQEVERAARWARTLRERVEKTLAAEGGYIDELAGECPCVITAADRQELESRVHALFRGEECRQDEILRRIRRADAAELRRLCGRALVDLTPDPDPTAAVLEALVEDWIDENLEDPASAGQLIDEDWLLDTLRPYPDRCAGCAAGDPCHKLQVGAEERETEAMLEGLDLEKCGWTVSIVQHRLRKRNLLRSQRTPASFAALVSAGVFDCLALTAPAVGVVRAEARPPTNTDAMLPPFSGLKRSGLVALWQKVLRAEAVHVDEWDFDAVATNMETEHVETADEAADAAALRNVLREGLEEPEWGEETEPAGRPL